MKVKHRRVGGITVLSGLGGVVLMVMGSLAAAWSLMRVGVVMLGVMAWGIVRFRRGPMESSSGEAAKARPRSNLGAARWARPGLARRISHHRLV